MVGRKSAERQPPGTIVEMKLRLPVALYVHLKDEAEQHHRSMNREVITLLLAPKRKAYREARQKITQAMRDKIEDLYGPGGLERLDAGLPVASPLPEVVPGVWRNGWSDDVLKDWFGG